MTGECGQSMPSGRRCCYDALECPLHSPSFAPIRHETLTHGQEVPVAELASRLGALALERVAGLDFDPASVTRFLRSLDLFRRFPPPSEDEDVLLAEVELRGVVMNGFAPRDPEEWALARKVFDDDAIEEFTRWVREDRSWEVADASWVPPIPEKDLPPALRGPQPNPGYHLGDRPRAW